ncbi:innexin inx2-like [Microplitis mediator]|uniref:innexin inx2-like n=1 Tax=Microplitis mediator TaxID=375433 RepID=UPI002553AAC1|nr:innexin inx2-like [Microplitis mediator]XP_057326645.1 innexin inx2-like [Microplitis mediator]
MFEVLSKVKGLLKIDQVCIDNNVFRLHYKATMILLVVFSVLITCKQFVGDPIDCTSGNDKIPQNVMDTYCWVLSTFTMPNLTGTIGKNIVYPGVGIGRSNEGVKYHKYYQWVCFMLFFQGILFYIPRYLWKIWEGGRIKMLMQDLNCPITSDAEKTEKNYQSLVSYLTENTGVQNFYAYRFFLCEILNFINVIGQIYLIDLFLDGEFRSYGMDVIKFAEMESYDRIDPMSRIFPKITKCSFHMFGSSGTIEKIDGLCVLPLNVINEKIYIFIWFWFIILGILSGLSLIYRIAVIMGPRQFRAKLLSACSRLSLSHHIYIITREFEIGDWFIFYQLSKNIDSHKYRQLIADVAKKLNDRNDYKSDHLTA